MSKLTKFKVRKSQFPLDFRIDNTTRDANIKTLVAMPGTVFEEGTEETAETYNGLQLGLVHSVIPVKSVANSIDYYTCDIEGIADFGMHNELKLQMKITSTNEYDQPKIKMNGNNYQIMRFDGVQLTQVLTGQLKTDNIYNLSFNGTLFILSSGMIAEKEVKALLDTTDFQATETKAGTITEARIKEIAPQPDLTPYVPFSKGFRNQNSTDLFVRTNGRITWASDFFEMYNGDNNQFMGAFHTNGSRAYYKVPNRNGGNWNRILDEHDFNNLNTTVNQIVGSYVRDLRMSGYVVGTIHHHNIGIERNGYVVTGVVQNTDDNIVDLIQMRALQMNRGENWYNVPFA